MRTLVSAIVAMIAGLAASTASAAVVTFNPLASTHSYYLPGGPYQEGGLQFLSLNGPLINGTAPSTGATLAFDFGPLNITAAGGDPHFGSKLFDLNSLDIGNYATAGALIRYEYIDATGYHAPAALFLDSLPGLQPISQSHGCSLVPADPVWTIVWLPNRQCELHDAGSPRILHLGDDDPWIRWPRRPSVSAQKQRDAVDRMKDAPQR